MTFTEVQKYQKMVSQISLEIQRSVSKLKHPTVFAMWGSLTCLIQCSADQRCCVVGLFQGFKALELQFYLTLTALKCCKSFWRGGKGIDSNSSNYGGVKVVAFWKAACTSSSSLACFLAILNATTPTVEVFLMQLLLHFTCQESWHEEEEAAAQSNRRKLANSHLNCI